MYWLKTFACSLYGTVVLAVIIVAGWSNPQYDDGGFGLFYHFVLIPVLGFMFYLVHEITRNAVLSAIIGLLFCVGADYVRHRLRTRRRKIG